MRLADIGHSAKQVFVGSPKAGSYKGSFNGSYEGSFTGSFKGSLKGPFGSIGSQILDFTLFKSPGGLGSKSLCSPAWHGSPLSLN